MPSNFRSHLNIDSDRSVLAECPDLDDGLFDFVVGIGFIELVLGYLTIIGGFDMVIGLLIYVTVDAADPPHVSVLTLLDHDTIANNQIILIGIDNQGRTCRQLHCVLIQRTLSMVFLDATTYQSSGQHTQAAMILGNRSTRDSAHSRSRSPLTIVVHGLNCLDCAVLQHYRLAGLLCEHDTLTKHHDTDYQQKTNYFHCSILLQI